ncbi:MAG TPA: DnaJ domain-containing protein [Cytophagales bacterium]|nr:DnaJ domain-containing protein [Cytophagales bacterium]
MDKNYYEILGLTKTATKQQIKDAYKKAALMYHPDKNQGSVEAEEKFKLVNEAYQVLSDYNKKYVFDQKLYASTLTLAQADKNYSIKYQTSYNYAPHFGDEGRIPKPQHNKEWSGALFFVTLILVVLVALVLYFL